MDFKFFNQQISKIKDLPLPGLASQYKMAPEGREELLKLQKAANKHPRKAAVMALFYPNKNQETHLLFILRKTYKGVHSNQVAFPGGKVEEQDANLLVTALRETHEEVGVAPENVTVIKELTDIYIPPSNFLVQPYMGLYKQPQPFVLQVSEVEAILEVSLQDVLNDAFMTSIKVKSSYANEVTVPAFKLNGYTVWGATAMMLSEIKELVKQVF